MKEISTFHGLARLMYQDHLIDHLGRLARATRGPRKLTTKERQARNRKNRAKKKR